MPAPKERDLEATRKSLTAWLKPRLEADELTLSELRGPSETGFSSDTLLFDASVRGGSGERVEPLVARIEPRGFNVFPSYDVSLQFRVMDALAPTPVPVPRMRWLETDESVLGASFYVMDRLAGRVPSDNPPYHVGGWIHDELAPRIGRSSGGAGSTPCAPSTSRTGRASASPGSTSPSAETTRSPSSSTTTRASSGGVWRTSPATRS